MLKRLNTFNLGASAESGTFYDYYSFTDQPITLIDLNKVFRTVQSLEQKILLVNPLVQFVNGLTLIAISFLKIEQHS